LFVLLLGGHAGQHLHRPGDLPFLQQQICD
jgi:hypothetical protein